MLRQSTSPAAAFNAGVARGEHLGHVVGRPVQPSRTREEREAEAMEMKKIACAVLIALVASASLVAATAPATSGAFAGAPGAAALLVSLVAYYLH
ncbi:hypothetical protein TRIUR3_10809 [Triticum urartu]|uniref:Uncharacterized protein n=1 Tax=Triticum urartu TaxID=4572 RepID=M7ZAQ0_TRIUA|nr:hypothetical protein TRIUR3_10809 [Triticum urartu]